MIIDTALLLNTIIIIQQFSVCWWSEGGMQQ